MRFLFSAACRAHLMIAGVLLAGALAAAGDAPPRRSDDTPGLPESLWIAKGLSNALAHVYEQARPSVVAIHTIKREQNPHNTREVLVHHGTGCGVILDNAGHIITLKHVVEDSQELYVQLDDRVDRPATLVGTDTRTDLAVLRLSQPPSGLPTATLGDSRRLRPGNIVLSLGHPDELYQSVSFGIVSGLDRTTEYLRYESFLQTDAAINPGSSGGPVVNLDGEVVGIVTHIATKGGGSEGLGFALPMHKAEPVLARLLAGGTPAAVASPGRTPSAGGTSSARSGRRGWLGITIVDVTAPHAAGRDGVRVEAMETGSPLYEDGIRPGDILLRFNRAPLRNTTELQQLVAGTSAGSEVPLLYLRDGTLYEITITVGAAPR